MMDGLILTSARSFRYHRNNSLYDKVFCDPFLRILQVWGANVDVQLVVDLGRVIDYMTKYVTKAEVRTIGTHSLLRRTARLGSESDSTVGTVIQRFMMKINGARDMGQHETAHLNLHIPMVHSSHGYVRVATNLDDRDATEEISVETTSPDAGRLSKKSLYETYLLRMDPGLWNTEKGLPPGIAAMNLHEFASKFHKAKDGKSIVPKKKQLGVIFYPYVSPDPEGPDYAKFCKHSLLRFKAHVADQPPFRANASDASVKRIWGMHMQSLHSGGSLIPQIVTNFRRRRAADAQEDNELETAAADDPNGNEDVELSDSEDHYDGLQMLFGGGQVEDGDEITEEVVWDHGYDWSIRTHEYAEDLSSVGTWVADKARGTSQFSNIALLEEMPLLFHQKSV